jgi:hypothetical protein
VILTRRNETNKEKLWGEEPKQKRELKKRRKRERGGPVFGFCVSKNF